MAKEIFAGKRKNKYKIVISKEAISRKNIAPLLKMHKKTLIISEFSKFIMQLHLLQYCYLQLHRHQQ